MFGDVRLSPAKSAIGAVKRASLNESASRWCAMRKYHPQISRKDFKFSPTSPSTYNQNLAESAFESFLLERSLLKPGWG